MRIEEGAPVKIETMFPDLDNQPGYWTPVRRFFIHPTWNWRLTALQATLMGAIADLGKDYRWISTL